LSGLAKCELIKKDSGSLQFSETIDDRITEWPHSWPHGEISYRLNNRSDDSSKRFQERAVTVALRAWQLRLSNLKFRKERNPDAHVDFNVSFEDLAHFDGKRGVLAHAYYPGQGDISGDCHINDNWNWVAGVHLATLSKPPLVPILMHEFGHSIGLRHDPFDDTDIMYPSFNLGHRKNNLGNRSIARAQERYGKRFLSARIIAYFQWRRMVGSDFR
jgi:hypothetical protein